MTITAAEALVEHLGIRQAKDSLTVAFRQADHIVAALLAQTPAGEGVYIAPDGTLMRAIDYGKHETGIGPLHHLVPIEGDDRD